MTLSPPSPAHPTGRSGAELAGLPATVLARLIRDREVSAAEVTAAALDRVQALDDDLHAFVELTAAGARTRAAEIDAALARGDEVGALAGVPVAIKDLIATRGITTRSGSPAYATFIPDEDDIVVERLRAADAVILGKTTVPELGFSAVADNPVSPTARNPWDPTRTPGGSSAGSGVAVATGMVPLALGSDGGGSVRIPASLCGVYGLKASMGRVPLYPGCRDERYPGMSSWETLEHIGPMTRTVDDAALLMSVIAGPDPRDRHSIPTADVDWRATAANPDLSGLRVAYAPDLGYLPVDPEVRRVVGAAARVFADRLGCEVVEADPGLTNPQAHFWALVFNDTDLDGMRAMVAEHGPRMSPHLVELVLRPWTAEDFSRAQTARKRLVNQMWRFMSDYDLLVTPTLAVPAFPVGFQGPDSIDGRMTGPGSWLGFLNPFNLTGQPAASVPAGFTAHGLPVGMQIVGRHLADATVLAASAAFEATAPWASSWPACVAATSTGSTS